MHAQHTHTHTHLTHPVPSVIATSQLMAAAAAQSSRRSLDSAATALKLLENPAIANARAGPRIFVGKLTKVCEGGGRGGECCEWVWGI